MKKLNTVVLLPLVVWPPLLGRRSGLQKRAPLGKSKLAGRTPTIVTGAPSMITVRPTADRSPPKRSCHSPWLNNTTGGPVGACSSAMKVRPSAGWTRSEEHTSELQSQSNLVCRLLLEKKKNTAT